MRESLFWFRLLSAVILKIAQLLRSYVPNRRLNRQTASVLYWSVPGGACPSATDQIFPAVAGAAHWEKPGPQRSCAKAGKATAAEAAAAVALMTSTLASP